MYLKSLELQGFKSFADKTVLTFDRAMSAVVGPNGSGKSNIADAIRWVLGEQSTRTLRGAKMEDVIFGGTEKRAQVGFAEVSLILDNSDSTLPLDAAEVMVTRRYYRSGESEYYINRSSVRLRDVHELFMDTGLGRDGYSIIGQGRIDEILSVKSGDRREIFEEAAGISKYRYRKEEAERKLEATRQNLLRVGDKLSELELTVGPLRQQAETAKKYLALRDELRVTEVSLWTAQLEKIAETGAKAKEDFDAVTAEYDAAKAALDLIYTKNERIAEEMRAVDILLEEKRAQLAEAETLEHAARGEAELAESRAAGHDENILRITREMDEQAGREKNLSEQIAEREKRMTEARAELEAAGGELEELTKGLEELAGRADELEGRADALEALASEKTEHISALSIERSSLDAARSELSARAQTLIKTGGEQARTREALETALAQKNKDLAALSDEREALTNVINGYELRLTGRRAKLDAAKTAAQRLSVERSAAESRAKLLGDMERDYEGFGRAVRLVMQEKEKLGGIHGPLSELISVEDKYTVAIETALGQALQNIIVDTEENGKNAISYLKRCDGGRATFFPLSSVRGRGLDERLEGEPGFIGTASALVKTAERYRDVILYTLGRTVVARDMDSAIAISRAHSQRVRIVTLDGQLINAGGSMTGGSLARGTGILSRANELKRLKDELGEFDARQAKSDKELREIEREVAAAEYENGVAKSELRTAEESILRAEGEKNSLKTQLETVSAAVETAQSERAACEKRISDILARVSAIDAETARIDEERKTLTEQLAGLRDSRSGLGGKRGELSERMARLREKRSGAEGELAALRSSIEELRRVGENYGGDRERREAQIAELRASMERERALASEKRTLEAERGKTCALVRESIAGTTAERMALEAKRTASDRELQSNNATLLNLERERGRLEQKTNESAMEERQITDKLWDSYGLTVLTAANVACEITSLSAARTRAGTLRRDMSALGEVNIGAVEEYARVSERYDFLNTQYEDISKAAGELEGIIGEITGKMRDVFAVEFKKINEMFGTTFVEIFGGGSARLELDDENDILNCGIEIRVQPPGKSLKTITLLSGGEKAFVAIALYFAILKVRPTPFCVLDEVDTALDDVNVGRFAEYMGGIDGGTQFILITHKRGTMERCDVLYGVTMPTPGVSRVLALNMNDVERELGIKLK